MLAGVGRGPASGRSARRAHVSRRRPPSAAGLPHLQGDYMGEHWLASFALLALTA
ncbi:MAG: DUF2891 family protein [Caulobacteraceae bacterium]